MPATFADKHSGTATNDAIISMTEVSKKIFATRTLKHGIFLSVFPLQNKHILAVMPKVLETAHGIYGGNMTLPILQLCRNIVLCIMVQDSDDHVET